MKRQEKIKKKKKEKKSEARRVGVVGQKDKRREDEERDVWNWLFKLKGRVLYAFNQPVAVITWEGCHGHKAQWDNVTEASTALPQPASFLFPSLSVITYPPLSPCIHPPPYTTPRLFIHQILLWNKTSFCSSFSTGKHLVCISLLLIFFSSVAFFLGQYQVLIS